MLRVFQHVYIIAVHRVKFTRFDTRKRHKTDNFYMYINNVTIENCSHIVVTYLFIIMMDFSAADIRVS